MNKRVTAVLLAFGIIAAHSVYAQDADLPAEQRFDQTDGIPTGENFFLLFRLYGPKSKDFYKTWMLGDLEKVE